MYLYRSDTDGLAYAPEEVSDLQSLLKPERQYCTAADASDTPRARCDVEIRGRLALQQDYKQPAPRTKVFSLQASALLDTSFNACKTHRQQVLNYKPSRGSYAYFPRLTVVDC